MARVPRIMVTNGHRSTVEQFLQPEELAMMFYPEFKENLSPEDFVHTSFPVRVQKVGKPMSGPRKTRAWQFMFKQKT
ncbi:MAG: hypothetical protein UU95_C0006G0021 [Parcubacteria group bacterium GW2011_GWC2_42_12]|nr:MAG: hypothetical protein UU95_C0006G0021 [Parcubacteria group bacterium GW2011_GWC2_42_12]KKT45198.1 MAG: hypothetical protein UW34_C0002G0016 [Parcubacteria group bacterium GW2011_GWA2_44_15]